MFAADVVECMTGFDYAAEFRGRYKSRIGAARVLMQNGGLPGILERLFDEVPPAQAQRGDVALLDTDNGPALGIVTGAIAAAAGESGLALIPMRFWMQAWKV
jgi:hypothetical protein